jgi:NADH:ubiquinone oxidoreductase subunit
MSPVREQVPIIMIFTNKTTTFFNLTSRDSKGKELWPSSAVCSHIPGGRRVWRYHRDNQNPSIEEEQTTQWPREKVQKDKQRSTKHAYKTKDRVTIIP